MEDTLARWNQTNWGAGPQVFADAEPEIRGQEWGTGGRHARLTAMFRGALEKALVVGGGDGDRLFFLGDDLEFHPRIGALVASWPALDDLRCGMASLLNSHASAIAPAGEFAARMHHAFPLLLAGDEPVGVARAARLSWRIQTGRGPICFVCLRRKTPAVIVPAGVVYRCSLLCYFRSQFSVE